MALADYLRRLQQGMQGIGQGMQGASAQLEQGFQNPMFHLGLGMLQGSQSGDPWGGAQQGMQTYGQFAQHALRSQALKREEEKEAEAEKLRKMQLEYIKSNPQILEKLRQTNPLAAAQIEMTGDIASIKGLQHFGEQPLSQFQQAQIANWDAQRQHAGRQADISEQHLKIKEASLRQGHEQFLAEHNLRADQFGFEAYKQQVAQQEKFAEKEQLARSAHVDLNANLGKLDEVTSNINRLTGSEAFDGLYSLGGQAPDVLKRLPGVGDFLGEAADSLMSAAGSNVPDARAMRNQIVDQMVFRTIQDLKAASETGATGLGPIAIPEFQALERAGTRLKDAKTPAAAREAAADLVKHINTMRQNMIDRAAVKVPAGMAPPPVPSAPAAPAAPVQTKKVISASDLQGIANKRGMSIEQVRKMAEDRGWVIQ